MVLVISQTTIARTDDSCSLNCKKALDAADQVIGDLHKEIDLYKQKDQAETNEIANLNLVLNQKNEELGSIWRNPWFLGTLGLVVGAAGTAYLLRR